MTRNVREASTLNASLPESRRYSAEPWQSPVAAAAAAVIEPARAVPRSETNLNTRRIDFRPW